MHCIKDNSECEFGAVQQITINENSDSVLQYCYGRQWRSVCGEFWTQRHTNVVCRELGKLTSSH